MIDDIKYVVENNKIILIKAPRVLTKEIVERLFSIKKKYYRD